MYAFFALVATVLTSLLPILNKRILLTRGRSGRGAVSR